MSGRVGLPRLKLANPRVSISEKAQKMLNDRAVRECRPATQIATEILEAVLEGRWSVKIPRQMTQHKKAKRNPQPGVIQIDFSIEATLQYLGMSHEQFAVLINVRRQRLSALIARQRKGLPCYVSKSLQSKLYHQWQKIPPDVRKLQWTQSAEVLQEYSVSTSA